MRFPIVFGQSQGSFRKGESNKAETLTRVVVFWGRKTNCGTSHHISFYSKVSCMRGGTLKVKEGCVSSRSKAEVLARVAVLWGVRQTVAHHITYDSTQKSVACEESTLKGKEGCVSSYKNEYGGLNGDRVGGEKAEEHEGACGACARDSVATAYERRPRRLPKHLRHYLVLTIFSYQLPTVLPSNRDVLRNVVNCRFFARGNLHRNLDLAARRPAVLAHVLSGYQAPRIAASFCPCIAGCEFVCAPGKVRTDYETFGVSLQNSVCPCRLSLKLTRSTHFCK
eukprot:426824-Pleurochrysis_carterae.AAC.1